MLRARSIYSLHIFKKSSCSSSLILHFLVLFASLSAVMHTITLYAAAFIVLGWALYAFANAISRRNAKYNPRGLPGPALVPWVGRIHDLPIQYMWLKFKEWADTYGPIYRTKMLGANFIIVSDESIAEEILVKRAKLYSDRPQIRSLFDSKSTFGSMEYLPLMGKNRELRIALVGSPTNVRVRVLGPPKEVHTLLPNRSYQRPLPRYHGVRGEAMVEQPSQRSR